MSEVYDCPDTIGPVLAELWSRTSLDSTRLSHLSGVSGHVADSVLLVAVMRVAEARQRSLNDRFRAVETITTWLDSSAVAQVRWTPVGARAAVGTLNHPFRYLGARRWPNDHEFQLRRVLDRLRLSDSSADVRQVAQSIVQQLRWSFLARSERAAFDRFAGYARGLGLVPLRQAAGEGNTIEYRIWTEAYIGVPKSLTRILLKNGNTTGEAYYYWHDYEEPDSTGPRMPTFSEVFLHELDGSCTSFRKVNEIGSCRLAFADLPQWGALADLIQRQDPWGLPPQWSLPSDSIVVMDGYGGLIEIRHGGRYHAVEYGNPNAHKHPENRRADSIMSAAAKLPPLRPPRNLRRLRGQLTRESGVLVMRLCSEPRTLIVESFPSRIDLLSLPALVEVSGIERIPAILARWSHDHPREYPARYEGLLSVRDVLRIEPWRPDGCRQ